MYGKGTPGVLYGRNPQKGDSASKKELDTLKDMRIVQEMYARGFEFVPIDLYTAKHRDFRSWMGN